MTARIYGTILLFFGISTLFAQETTPSIYGNKNTLQYEQCAQNEIRERRMAENPAFAAEQEAQEEMLDDLVRQYNNGMIPKTDEIFTVPVVVHIIHDGDAYGTGSNISDEQIYSAINGLNQDFRKMTGTNGDGAGADIGVEFCLAQRDPSGNPSTGITRTNGCSVPLYCTEGITAGNGQGANELTVKNLSRWPNQQYYNIWVVTEIENNNGGSGIQGYAYFPTTSQVDGVVLLYNTFGTEGNLKSYTNMNRTLTHEMGHAFGLYHTFQGGSCAVETNCVFQGDRVCDTPPTTLNSNCNNPACGGTQQVENYMDYTSQTCKNMFTEGQKTRMRTAIQNLRSNLINANSCQPITQVLANAAIADISEPTGNTCTNMIQPKVQISNEGSVNLATAVIQYRTAGAWQSYNWTGLLGPGQSVYVTMPLYDGGWGQRTLEAKTSNPNGGADAAPGNDSFSIDYNAVQNGHTLTLNITLDILGGQTSWLLRNGANETLASGGPYANFQSGSVETEVFCVDNGCYDLVIFDAGGNGICCATGNGSYELRDENNAILASGASFGNQDVTNFCVNAGGSPPVADFSAANVNICEGGSTTFNNLTSGDVDSFSWKFFGGTPFTASGANPGTITYSTPGTYNVRLSATNQYGQDVELKSGYITVDAGQTWYADTDGDGHGDPSNTTSACAQPAGYVALGDDCDDSNGGSWNSCYDCLGVMNGTAYLDNCGTCDSNAGNDCEQDCLGVWGGSAVMDNCGTCDSNAGNDCEQDCLGVWGGSAVMDNCGVCDSNPSNDCTQDCAGVWGGTAVMDNCGVCDSNPSNDCTQDCLGVWGGTAVMDNCGVCDSNPSNDCTQDCLGVWGGTAVMDNCGVCDSNPSNDCTQDCLGVWGGTGVMDNCGVCDSNPSNDCTQDCLGVWGGSAIMDNCGVCDADPSNDCAVDCLGVLGGTAVMDNCGVCDSDPTNDCTQDCLGVWGGTAVMDNCGVCDSNASNDCVQDCAGVWGGSAAMDNCGVCDANTLNDCQQDCLGDWGGTAVMDNCGVCDSDPTNDCIQDCLGVWGGTAIMDNCGVCDSDASNDCVQDCAGVWGGSAVMDNCGVCDVNPANDCTQDCAGVWGGDAYYDECGTCDSDPSNDCVPCEGLGLTLSASSEPSCHGGNDGSISVEATSLSGNYTLIWNTGASTESISNLTAGTYSVTLLEDGCTAFLEVILGEPDAIEISVNNIVNDGCENGNTGSAELIIAGGTAPYNLTVNNEVVWDPVLSSLAAGTYDVSVSDAHSCNSDFSFTVGQENCDSLTMTNLVPSICAQGSIGFFGNAACETVPNAISYSWIVRDLQDLNNLIEFNTSAPVFMPNDIPGIIPGLVYGVRVKGLNPTIPSDFGPECQVSFTIGTAKLTAIDCGNMTLSMSDVISNTGIQGSTDYEFRFEDAVTGERYYYYSGGAITCPLADVATLQTNTEYLVAIRGKYRNIWGEYGEICAIQIAPVVLTTALTDVWCENFQIDIVYDQLIVQPIENASVYELRISDSGEGNEIAVQNSLPAFPVISIPGIVPNHSYTAQARAYIDGEWTVWGKVCEIAFNDPDMLKLNMFIFPNPIKLGSQIYLRTDGDWENLIIQVCDAQGHHLKTIKKDFKDMQPQRLDISGLRTGMYFVNVTHGKQSLSKKFIVQ